MNFDKPKAAWLYAWGVTQVISVVLSLTIIPARMESAVIKQVLILTAALSALHSVTTYLLLLAANCPNERSFAISVASTGAILCIAAFPREPRVAQSLAAVVFIAIVCWQTVLKAHEE